MPVFETNVPIVGILFPVPQIMIHQLLGILFFSRFFCSNCDPPITRAPFSRLFKIIFSSQYYGCFELNFLRKPAKTC